jgi:uncharacterized protein involved in exopolysaccharide biosynthesis
VVSTNFEGPDPALSGSGTRTGDADIEIDIARILRVLWSGKWLITMCTVMGIVAALLIMRLLPPAYEATMILIPAPTLTRSNDAPPSPQGIGGLLSTVFSRQDQNSAGSVARFQALFTAPETVERADKEHGLLRRLYKSNWDEATGTWRQQSGGILSTIRQSLREIVGLPGWQPPNYQTASQQLEKSIKIQPREQTLLWDVSTESHDPTLVRDLLVWMHDAADSLVREQMMARTQENIAYLTDALQHVASVDQRLALTNLLTSQDELMMMSKAGSSFAMEIVRPPLVPTQPKSRLASFLAIGFLGGLLIGGTLALVLRRSRAPAPRHHMAVRLR